VIPAPEDGRAAAARARMRASHADREHTVDTLKVAFVQGRLTEDEFDARLGQALSVRTCGELAAIVIDIPSGLVPVPRPPRRHVGHGARWGAAGVITPALLGIAVVFGSVHGAAPLAVLTFLAAFFYFVIWLSAGADMLWEWHCLSVPRAGMCVRCAHSAASHRTALSCTVRVGAVKPWLRCACAGYVPPGRLPEAA
jgi:hypothetical protein